MRPVLTLWVMCAVGILLLAGVSFFFSLAETALGALPRWEVRRLAEMYPRRGPLVQRLTAQPEELLATTALGNTLAVGAILLLTLMLATDTPGGRWLAVLGASAGVLALCEVVPKALAVRAPARWALRVAHPLAAVQGVLGPLRRGVSRLAAAAQRRLASRLPRRAAARPDEELGELLEMAAQQGALLREEKDIIQAIVSLDRRQARDVMRPRATMDALSDELSVAEMCAAARRLRRRRLPIYDESPDTIVGILNTNRLLLDPEADLAEAMDFPSFVPESMNLLALFLSLQRQRRGVVVVLDEFGVPSGLVRLEDIIGEMLPFAAGGAAGTQEFCEALGPGRWRVGGATRMSEFRRHWPALGNIPGVKTMGGLLCAQLDVVPSAGQSASFAGLRLTAQLVDPRRVRELLVETELGR